MKRMVWGLVAAMVLAPGAALAGHGKAGLWTVTSSMQMADMPDMPPQVMEMMKKRGMPGMGQPMTTQMCMTQQDVDTDAAARMSSQREVNCTPRILSQSATSVATEVVCHGAMEGTGHAQISWRGDSHYEGTYNFKGTMHGQPNAMTSHFSGDWVKADCGSVKPYAPGGAQ